MLYHAAMQTRIIVAGIVAAALLGAAFFVLTPSRVSAVKTETEQILEIVQNIQSDVDQLQTTQTQITDSMLSQALIRDYGVIPPTGISKEATSTGPFVLFLCAHNTNTNAAEQFNVHRALVDGSQLIIQAQFDINNPEQQCFTVGGVAGDTLTFFMSNNDGNSRVTATMLTSADATASIEP